MTHRSQQNYFDSLLFNGKSILIFGARQVGKTSIMKKTIENHSYLWLNGDEPDYAATIRKYNFV